MRSLLKTHRQNSRSLNDKTKSKTRDIIKFLINKSQQNSNQSSSYRHKKNNHKKRSALNAFALFESFCARSLTRTRRIFVNIVARDIFIEIIIIFFSSWCYLSHHRHHAQSSVRETQIFRRCCFSVLIHSSCQQTWDEHAWRVCCQTFNCDWSMYWTRLKTISRSQNRIQNRFFFIQIHFVRVRLNFDLKT